MQPEVTWFGKGNRWPVGKKGAWAHATGSHVFLEWETADQLEKGIVGSRGSKTAEKTRAQSPKSNVGNGGGPWKQDKINKWHFFIDLFYNNSFEFLFDMRVP